MDHGYPIVTDGTELKKKSGNIFLSDSVILVLIGGDFCINQKIHCDHIFFTTPSHVSNNPAFKRVTMNINILLLS